MSDRTDARLAAQYEAFPYPHRDPRDEAKRLIVGSPETCVRECLKYQQELGATNMLARMKFPGLPHDRVLNSIRLWAEKVMPFIQ